MTERHLKIVHREITNEEVRAFFMLHERCGYSLAEAGAAVWKCSAEGANPVNFARREVRRVKKEELKKGCSVT